MHKPAWIMIVGILGIVLSCFGILGAANTLVMPKVAEFQKEMFAKIQTEAERDVRQKVASDPVNRVSSKEFFEMFRKIWDIPAWYDHWCFISGIISVCIWGFVLFASILLIQLKISSPKFFSVAFFVNIVYMIVDSAVSAQAGSFLGISKIAGNTFWIVVSIPLLIAVATSDKKVFTIA